MVDPGIVHETELTVTVINPCFQLYFATHTFTDPTYFAGDTRLSLPIPDFQLSPPEVADLCP